MIDLANHMPAQEIAWTTRDSVEQLTAVIGCAAKLDCFDTLLEGDFETVRVLLNLSKNLAEQVEASSQQWEAITAQLENAARYPTAAEPLSGESVLGLLKSLAAFSQDKTQVDALACSVSALAERTQSDESFKPVVTFIVDLMRESGVKAKLVHRPGCSDVVVWDVADNYCLQA